MCKEDQSEFAINLQYIILFFLCVLSALLEKKLLTDYIKQGLILSWKHNGTYHISVNM